MPQLRVKILLKSECQNTLLVHLRLEGVDMQTVIIDPTPPPPLLTENCSYYSTVRYCKNIQVSNKQRHFSLGKTLGRFNGGKATNVSKLAKLALTVLCTVLFSVRVSNTFKSSGQQKSLWNQKAVFELFMIVCLFYNVDLNP